MHCHLIFGRRCWFFCELISYNFVRFTGQMEEIKKLSCATQAVVSNANNYQDIPKNVQSLQSILEPLEIFIPDDLAEAEKKRKTPDAIHNLFLPIFPLCFSHSDVPHPARRRIGGIECRDILQ